MQRGTTVVAGGGVVGCPYVSPQAGGSGRCGHEHDEERRLAWLHRLAVLCHATCWRWGVVCGWVGAPRLARLAWR